jgi:hypothetical protein
MALLVLERELRNYPAEGKMRNGLVLGLDKLYEGETVLNQS